MKVLLGIFALFLVVTSCKKNDTSTTSGSSNIVVDSVFIGGKYVGYGATLHNIPLGSATIKVSFLNAVTPDLFSKDAISISNGIDFNYQFSQDGKSLELTTKTGFSALTSYALNIPEGKCQAGGKIVAGYKAYFVTVVDSTPKFPLLSDSALLTKVQQQTFRYFWDFAHPSCGMARERNTSGDVVTTGGSGFGVMALVVGMQRGFITRSQGLARFGQVLTFLETCDRFYGAWPHWLNGITGKTVPFSSTDDGGDLVETSYMVQGLITMRQYLDSTVTAEKSLITRINALNNSVEYDWYTHGENVLYWQWSPDYGWASNVKIQGYNETLITYVIAATSTTHPVSSDVYKSGYTRNGAFKNGNSYYGYLLPLGEPYGGPLFFTQYTYLGLDPRHLQDAYANYWEQNVNHSLINWSYCAANPRNYVGYSTDCWGLTASDNPWGYNAHSPTNDLGVITPTAAVSSIPYTPTQSLKAIRYFYYVLGDKLWGDYGFYDAFDMTDSWWASSYIAIDEGPIICMIENYRTGLLWNLFMSAPEVKKGLDKLSFTY
ncbi:MAG TPA: glucoamylase family protein [Bacteroidales bacterium]